MRPKNFGLLLVFVFIFAAATSATGFDHSHSAWDTLLRQHVTWVAEGVASRVDYAAFKKERAQLRAYLDSLTAVSGAAYSGWSKPQRLAFLINSYNAFTIDLILSKYPVDSIKNTVSLFRNPWKQKFFTLFGENSHLDHIEHDLIRKPGDFDEPRIHFAVVCAAIGCPGIRNEAFTASKIEAQLEDSLKRFLADRSRNRYNPSKQRLEVSKIFDWYGSDFSSAQSGKYQSLAHFFAAYATLLTDDTEGQARIRALEVKIDYLDYDWALNDRDRESAP